MAGTRVDPLAVVQLSTIRLSLTTGVRLTSSTIAVNDGKDI
jgi:hypothetical protein